MELTIRIQTGNDAMNKAHQLADALESIAHRIRNGNNYDQIMICDHFVRDENGNKVGEWQIA